MAQDTSLQGLRSQLVTSIFGRRLALDVGDYLVGPRAFREQVEGGIAAGSTVITTSVAGGTTLSVWGISMVGATAASASTAYTLPAPVPGVRKIIFNPTTGHAQFSTTVNTTSVSYICSTASVTSTYNLVSLYGKGTNVELIGLTTALWGLLGSQISSLTTNVTIL